jgi:dTMP kinase
MLRKKFPRALVTHDPGGTEAGEAIRALVLGKHTLSPLAILFLFLASRAALVEQKIIPALSKGKLVLCDRFDSSTYAYQAYAGKRPGYAQLVQDFRADVFKKFAPDAYIMLDSDPKKARKRLFGARGKSLNSYDKKPLSYHRQVRAGFKKFKPKGSKVYILNADRASEEVFKDVSKIVSRILK